MCPDARACAHVNMYAIASIWKSEDSLGEWGLSFHPVGSWDRTQVSSLGSKHPSSLNHLVLLYVKRGQCFWLAKFWGDFYNSKIVLVEGWVKSGWERSSYVSNPSCWGRSALSSALPHEIPQKNLHSVLFCDLPVKWAQSRLRPQCLAPGSSCFIILPL